MSNKPINPTVIQNGNVTAPNPQPRVGHVTPGSHPFPASNHPALGGPDPINGTISDLSDYVRALTGSGY